jgi:succinate-acetate transporter protein
VETAIRQPRLTRPQATIFLQPVAAPAVLGYFALASALFIYGGWFAQWWGTEKDASSFFPFLLLFGGVGQLSAALWGYRARAAVAAALHGSWGAFWLGLGLIYLLVTTHTIQVPARGAEWQSLGEWFVYMTVITATTAVAALRHSPVGFVAQATLTAGCLIAAIALSGGSSGWQQVAGWLFVAASALAFAVGAALMVTSGGGEPVEYAHGDPGVKVGQ